MKTIDPVEAFSTFQGLNRTRIERLSTMFPLKSHFFLEVLPLLFQTNDPMLPGYISQATPAGIVDYQPNNAALDAAKTINHAFQYKRHSLHHYPLRGLYLLNDNGLLNYHTDIPFELWLVYAQPIAAEELELLQKKITAICAWSFSFFQIKLTGRLLNEESLSDQITTPDLDRFYHSGLLLAGLSPSWWSLPPASQTESLTSSLSHNNVLDFGSLASREDGPESLSNKTLELIDKAMDSGMECSLTIIFQNIQLQQYPDFSWLSELLKQAIYAGVTDPMLLDKSSLELNYITAFSHDPEIVLIAQQSFYIHSKEHLSKTVSSAIYPWRRTFIEEQYHAWQWPKDLTATIDKRGASHYRQLQNEYHDVRQQIANTMQSVFLFAQQQQLNIEVTRQKLKRKFKILFDRDLDVIDSLPWSFRPQSGAEQLYLARTSQTSNWQINDLPATLSTQPLYQHQSLLNVLAWAVNNQLLTKATRLQLVDQVQKVKMRLVTDLIHRLLQSPLRKSTDIIDPPDLDTPSEIDNILLFANLEHRNISSLSQQGLELTSLQTDPLNYANSKQNLLASVEALICSTWGHWHYIIYTGPTALLALLGTVIQWQPKKESALTANCWCPSENHGQKISLRVETVYNAVIDHYVNHNSSGDYLISIADHYYRLQWQQGLVDILPLNNNKSLEQHLAEERDIFSASNIDPILDESGFFQLILSQQVEKCISLFLLSKNNGITLSILDDLGTLFKLHSTDLTAATLINHYQQFFSQLNNITDIRFFYLKHSKHLGWEISKITQFNLSSNNPMYLPVRVELDSTKENAHCSIHCGAKKFIGKINDPTLFKQVSDLVLNIRNTTSRYPLYINQLSFTTGQTYSTRQYIILKQHIETLLNKTENLSL